MLKRDLMSGNDDLYDSKGDAKKDDKNMSYMFGTESSERKRTKATLDEPRGCKSLFNVGRGKVCRELYRLIWTIRNTSGHLVSLTDTLSLYEA